MGIGYQQIRDEDFEDYMALLGAHQAQHLQPATAFEDEIRQRLDGTFHRNGDRFIWAELQQKMVFVPGHVSIWAGLSGQGKSLFLGMQIAWWLKQRKCAIASLEMPPAETVARMLRQVSGMQCPPPDKANKWLKWSEERLWIYDQVDTVPADKILGMVHYAAGKLGCRHIVIDSLLKCGLPQDGTGANTAVTQFIDKLTWAAKRHDTHIHLVAHSKKIERGQKAPTQGDTAGTANISNLGANHFVVTRNTSKHTDMSDGLEYDINEHDGEIFITKNRETGQLSRLKFYFHQPSGQYTTKRGQVIPWRTDGEKTTPVQQQESAVELHPEGSPRSGGDAESVAGEEYQSALGALSQGGA